jgi:hypothetical protein
VQGLTVQGVNSTRLTPYPNQSVSVPDEAIGLRNLARQFTESKTAIAQVGLGLRPVARTVSAHVQAAIFFAELAQKVVNSPDPPTLIPKQEHHSNNVEVEIPQPLQFAYKYGSGPEVLARYTPGLMHEGINGGESLMNSDIEL